MTGLPSLHALDRAQVSRIWLELPESVKQMVDSVYGELKVGRKRAAGSCNLLPNATKRKRGGSVSD